MEKPELKAGLEVHQQLDTGKLFCDCPSLLRQDEPLFRVERKLNPVVGETGKVDVAAAHEKSKNKTFIYEVYDTNCLVELDEEPPHSLNLEALKVALQIATLMNCKIFPVSQVMRKTVIDGSNTSGFQRTVLIAHDGFIETSLGNVGIETVALEEDAARIISNQGDKAIYRLDRLGIPLVEITTKPDLKTPEQIKEAALKIGEILRACKVKRGIGTIRQDVNVSISGGERVEIKGFQEPRIMVKTVELEMLRQQKLIEMHNELKKAKKAGFEEILDVGEIFKNTECKLIKNALDKKNKVYGVRLEGFAGLFGRELYEGRRFGTEVSDYAKMYGVGGIIHSDEKLEKYSLSEKEINEVKDKLGIAHRGVSSEEQNSFVLVVGEDEKASKAIEAAIKRAKMQIDLSVPKEVRKSNEDGSTSFLRPMPGSARMYPETDIPLLKISRDLINEVKSNLPKLKTELRGYLEEFGLNEELVKLILQEDKIEEFKELMQVIDNPNLIAKALVVFPREIAAKDKKSSEEIEKILSFDIIESVLAGVSEGKIIENDVRLVLQKIAEGKTLKEALKKEEIDLRSEIEKLMKEKPNLSANAYMGLVMAKFKGKVNGKEVMEQIQKVIDKKDAVKRDD